MSHDLKTTENSIVLANQDAFYFKAPAILSVIGPSNVGKSYLVAKILRDRSLLIKPTPKIVIYVYNIWQNELFEQLKLWVPGIRFVSGLADLQKITFTPNVSSIIILDDQQQALLNANEYAVQLFSVEMHHKSMFIIYVGQTLFLHGKNNAMLNRQSSYIIMFRNKRSSYESEVLARQTLQLKPAEIRWLYKDAANMQERPYLVWDLNPATSEHRQLCTNILPEDCPKVFYYISEPENGI